MTTFRPLTTVDDERRQWTTVWDHVRPGGLRESTSSTRRPEINNNNVDDTGISSSHLLCSATNTKRLEHNRLHLKPRVIIMLTVVDSHRLIPRPTHTQTIIVMITLTVMRCVLLAHYSWVNPVSHNSWETETFSMSFVIRRAALLPVDHNHVMATFAQHDHRGSQTDTQQLGRNCTKISTLIRACSYKPSDLSVGF